MGADEYYVLTIEFPHKDGKWYSFEQVWIKNTSWGGSAEEHLEWFLYNGDELGGSRERKWYVVVKRKTGLNNEGKPIGEEVSPQSDKQVFIWERSQ